MSVNTIVWHSATATLTTLNDSKLTQQYLPMYSCFISCILYFVSHLVFQEVFFCKGQKHCMCVCMCMSTLTSDAIQYFSHMCVTMCLFHSFCFFLRAHKAIRTWIYNWAYLTERELSWVLSTDVYRMCNFWPCFICMWLTDGKKVIFRMHKWKNCISCYVARSTVLT